MIIDGAQDRAIEKEADDLLGRLPFVRSLARALVREVKDSTGKVVARRSTGVVVGLTGTWGLGKSSTLNLLAEELRNTKMVDVAVLNPWLFKGREELLVAFFSELRKAMGKSGGAKASAALAALRNYEWAVRGVVTAGAIAVDLKGGSGLATTSVNGLWSFAKSWKGYDLIKRVKLPEPKIRSPIDERRALEAKLEASDRAVVVLIDELDRVEDDDVRAVAQLIKAVGDIRGISYLVAYDPRRVADALGRGEDAEARRKSGEAYLEKIVQHTVPLRRLFPEDIEALLAGALETHGVSLSPDLTANEDAILRELRAQIATPREVKRLISSFAVLEPMVRREISKIDVLAYAWLLSKSPALHLALSENFDQVVDDPTIVEQMARTRGDRQTSATPLALLGSSAEPHDRLLRLLFPRFGQSREGEADDGTRMSRRRNLVRLLYLGDPPGVASRREVEALWEMDDIDALADALRARLADGRIVPIMDRLGDIVGGLDGARDTTFWPALARALERPTDWMTGPELNESVSEAAYAYLTRLGGLGPRGISRIGEALVALENQGDLIISPRILRRDMFIHGLVTGQPRSGDSVQDQAATERMLARRLPHFRQALLEGRLLRRVPNAEALFILSHSGTWDEELRSALTEQMRIKEARATLAGLITPPGHAIDQSSLDAMMDAERVATWIDEDPPTDEWSEVRVNRLRRMLRGEHRIGMT